MERPGQACVVHNRTALHRTSAGVLGENAEGIVQVSAGLEQRRARGPIGAGSGWVWPWVGWMALAYVRYVLGKIHMAIRCLMGVRGCCGRS